MRKTPAARPGDILAAAAPVGLPAAGVLLAAVTAAAWGPSIANGFVFDDLANVQANPWIRDWTLLPKAFAHHAAGFDADYDTSFYRPLMHVLYGVAYRVAGEQPWAFHLLNVLVNVAAVLCAFALVRAAVTRWSEPATHAHVPLVAALVFALHPIHAEPVHWIAGITDLSYTLFGLLALLAYMNALERAAPAVPAAMLLLASLLSKETGVAIAALIIVLEWLERANVPAWRMRAAVTRLLGPAIALGLYVAVRLWALGAFAPSAAQHPRAPAELAGLAGELFARYMGLLVAPLQLTVVRDVTLAGTLASPLALLGLALFVAMACVAVGSPRRPLVVLAVALAALPVFPALYVPAIESGVSVMGDRYLYLPVLGSGIAVGVALEAVARRSRWGGRVAVTALAAFALWGVTTALMQARVWSSSLTLWNHAVAAAPRSAAAHEGLCFALYQEARYAEALEACARALAIEPRRLDASINHATALLALGRPGQARGELDKVLAMHPQSPHALVSRGLACMMLGAHEDALASYRRAIAIQPWNAEAHNVLGVALVRLGRPAEALDAIEAAVRLAPGNAEYRANLEVLRARSGPM